MSLKTAFKLVNRIFECWWQRKLQSIEILKNSIAKDLSNFFLRLNIMATILIRK